MDPWGGQVSENKSYYMWRTIRYHCPELEGFVHDPGYGQEGR